MSFNLVLINRPGRTLKWPIDLVVLEILLRTLFIVWYHVIHGLERTYKYVFIKLKQEKWQLEIS